LDAKAIVLLKAFIKARDDYATAASEYTVAQHAVVKHLQDDAQNYRPEITT
jgi:hypothetical protein